LPIHVYDTATGRPVAVILRPGKTPSGVEVRGHIRRLVRAVRRHWPTTRITIRGDGHYCRSEIMDFCEANGIGYVFGLTGTPALAAKVELTADAVRVERALEDKDGCAASPRRHTPPSPRTSHVASRPASRPPAWASTSAMW
jgi:Transposase DDE domain group 1